MPLHSEIPLRWMSQPHALINSGRAARIILDVVNPILLESSGAINGSSQPSRTVVSGFRKTRVSPRAAFTAAFAPAAKPRFSRETRSLTEGNVDSTAAAFPSEDALSSTINSQSEGSEAVTESRQARSLSTEL